MTEADLEARLREVEKQLALMGETSLTWRKVLVGAATVGGVIVTGNAILRLFT
jgi:hypothetical protein